jgi:hypothetical protein
MLDGIVGETRVKMRTDCFLVGSHRVLYIDLLTLTVFRKGFSVGRNLVV